MAWVLLCTFLSYVVVNLPLIYSVKRVHGLGGVVALWGYAPNQFLFLTLIYPFAAFCTFTALHYLVVRVRVEYSTSFLGRRVLDQWPAVALVGLLLAVVITLVVYFTSAMSLDKLKPEYAKRAIVAASEVQRRISAARPDDRERLRDSLLEAGRRSVSALSVAKLTNADNVRLQLEGLSSEGYLRLVQRPAPQLRLTLFDPTLHALNVFQLLVALFSATLLLLAVVLCYVSAKDLSHAVSVIPSLRGAIDSAYFAVFFFALYPIFFHQYRAQLDPFVGPGATVLQDIIAAAVVIGVLLGLNSIDPAHRVVSLEASVRLVPALLIGSGFAAEKFKPDVMQQLIGKDTNLGIQVIVIVLVSLFGLVPVFKIWPR